MQIETYKLTIADDKTTKSLFYGGNEFILITSNIPEDTGEETTITFPRHALACFLKIINE
jgi:ribosomal protein L30E